MPNDRLRLAGVFATFLLVAALGSPSVTLEASSTPPSVTAEPASHSRLEPARRVSELPEPVVSVSELTESTGPTEPTAPPTQATSATASGAVWSAQEPVRESAQEPVSDREPEKQPAASAREPASAQDPASAPRADTEPPAEPVYVADDGEEIGPDRIRRFLEGRGAPLAEHAEELVRAGVEHDVDPRLVVGIAVAESAGGERLPPSTHNAWGWSGDGPHGLKSWSSWPEAIDDFTARFGRLYDVDRVDASMARTYVPPNWRWWLETVTWVIDEI